MLRSVLFDQDVNFLGYSCICQSLSPPLSLYLYLSLSYSFSFFLALYRHVCLRLYLFLFVCISFPLPLFSHSQSFSIKSSPKNFRKYNSVGELSMRQALTKSVNTATVRIAMQVGAQKVGAVAQRLGITSDMIPDMSICLGTTEVTLLELVSAYATFANKGKSVWAYGITEIRNRNGDILYQRENDAEEQVINVKHVRQMNDMLINVVSNGTGRAARLKCAKPDKNTPAPTIELAGKTGSNADKDAWFVGFTKDLVAGIWTGNDNNAPMHKNSTGARIPANTFSAFMTPITCETPPDESLLPAVDGESNDAESIEEQLNEEALLSEEAQPANTDMVYSTKSPSVFDEPAADSSAFEALLNQAAQE